MVDAKEVRLADLLRQAQTMMVELSGRSAGADRDWDKAKALLDGARQIDALLAMLAGQPAAQAPASIAGQKLPYYYTERDKLVKVGRSREDGTYEHRVIRDHYEHIVGQLCELATQGPAFETRRLVSRCHVPAHEPLIVVNLLGQHRLLDGLRRGRWSFVDAAGFKAAVGGIWDKLPRR